MKTNNISQKVFFTIFIAMIFAVLAQAADVAGTWIWTVPNRNGGAERTNTLTLKFEDSKLTGKIARPGREGKIMESPITDGKVDGTNVTFTVVREYNGNSFTNTYSGAVTADTITGKMEYVRDGETQSRDWVAKRSTDSTPTDTK
jgi:hypothetical protein